ncbi:MAG: TonB-dependent receptor [Tannerellaceae bacterium]|jgi:hypothetical protein|nr:TonB-dependent receptor [Tannerellaceae bacterium]
MIRNFLLTAFFFLAATVAMAQTGEIRGVIIDKLSGDPLTGANIVIESLNIGAAAGIDGDYSFRAPAGTYTVKIKFISYNSLELTGVVVTEGRTTEANAALEEAATGLEEVTVVAVKKMNSEVSLINAMKSSPLTLSGISSQQIARTQDRDAAEAVKRIPGISIIDNRFIIARGLAQRYNNVWINNSALPSSEADSRSFSFDMIPGAQIDNIMIVKSPAPELPADFTGGFVKIATKNMPGENSIQASYGVNFNTETHFRPFTYSKGGPTDFLGFDNSLRPTRSIVPSTRIDNADDALVTAVTRNGFNNDWLLHEQKPIADQRFSFMINRYAKAGREGKLGLTAAINYSYAFLTYHDMTNARFGIYNKMDDLPEYFYKYADDQYSITAKTSAMLNFAWMINDNHRIELRNIYNQSGRDRYTFRDGWRNISSRYEQHKEEYLYASRGVYAGQLSGTHELGDAGKTDWTLGYSYADKRQPDRRQIDLEEEGGRYGMNSIIRDFNSLDENMYSIGANYSLPLKLGRIEPTVKAGLYAGFRSRSYGTRFFIYKARLGNLPPDFLYGDVATEMMRPEYFEAGKFYISDASDRTNDYSGTDFLGSAYFALNLPLGKFNVYAGLRYEDSRIALTNHTTINTDATETFDYDRANIFPSLNTTYKLGARRLLRFAYGRSVNRQEFREVSPSTYYDFDLFSYVKGNKKLEPAQIDNFDFRYEIYPASGQMISIAAFYKRFVNPIEWTYIDAGGSYTFTFENAGRADNYGLEIDIIKSLDEWGLKDFSVAFNGAVISSNVVFAENSIEHNRPMQGQSPYILNLGLFRQGKNLNVGLMYNIIGKRIVGIGRTDNSQGGTIDNNVPDMYELPRHALDLSLSYKFSKHVELSAGIRDILAQPLVYKQYPEFIDENGKIQKREQTTKEYNPGRNISLTLKITL